jgi:hypothetical protein
MLLPEFGDEGSLVPLSDFAYEKGYYDYSSEDPLSQDVEDTPSFWEQGIQSELSKLYGAWESILDHFRGTETSSAVIADLLRQSVHKARLRIGLDSRLHEHLMSQPTEEYKDDLRQARNHALFQEQRANMEERRNRENEEHFAKTQRTLKSNLVEIKNHVELGTQADLTSAKELLDITIEML